MTKRKFLSLLLVMLLIFCTFTVVSCDFLTQFGNKGKTEWPEAGEYKFTAGTTECTLTLNEGDTFTLVYKGTTESGTYTLTDDKLVLDFTADGKENVTATYAETTITLTYDGANMMLYKNINYTVSFAANGGTSVASQTVVNGNKATQPAAPTRTGYEFLGWYADSSFTSMFNFETPITADTTLYARWLADTKLPEPEITVTANSINWNSIAGARSYLVEIIAPDGEVVYDEETGSTVINVSFKDFAPAVYTVRVTAKAQTGEADNSVKEVTFAFNALDKVTGFQVIDPLLLKFDGVENAEKYLITVVCGDEGHNHTDLDIGTDCFFSLENCVMTKDGIQITVTAVAEGYASSVSETFVYKNELAVVDGLAFNEANHTIVWNEVDGATAYMVSVKCGDDTHNHDFVNVGAQTFVSVKDCAPLEGGIIVKVYPIAKGALSPEPSTYVYEKTDLQTPSQLAINGTVLTWKAVNGANSYEIMINGNVYTATEASFDMADAVGSTQGTEYAISVRALGASASSVWSDEITACYQAMGATVTYSKSVLTWAPVIGVTGYEIQVNDGEIVSVAGGNTSSEVVLTKTGVNTVKVRFVNGNNTSDWKSVEVTAYSVTFDTLGGSEIIVQYKAVGDVMTLPTATKAGYDFAAWYNLPGGAADNGQQYTDAFFAGSENIVLYAQYIAKQYEIVYNYGIGGTGTDEKTTVSYNGNYTLEVPTANALTDVFGGWYSLPYGKGIRYTDAKGNSLAPWTDLEGAELYAFWIEDALDFTLTSVNGKAAYMVSKGTRISFVSEVTVPATYEGLPVAMVAGNAFLDCPGIKVINLPATIEQISTVAPFGNCTGLEAVNVYEVEGVVGRFWSADGVLYDNGLSAVANPTLYYMPLAKTGSYTIPAGVTAIPAYALANSMISEIVIPESVVTISRNAFANCVNLTSVVFEAPKSATSASALKIGAGAFSGCTALESIVLPARLDEIKLDKITYAGGALTVENAENAFAGCTALASVTVESGSATYKSENGVIYSLDGKTLLYCPEGNTFEDGKLEIPAGVVTIASGAFMGCSAITEISVPNSVALIGDGAFYGMTELTKVTLGADGLVNLTIGNDAFGGCSNLAELVTENSRVAVIGERAFKGCSKLAALAIPALVTEIKEEAFSDCSSLGSISFAADGQILAFGEDVFANCTALTSVSLPKNVSAIPGIFSGCTSLTEVIVDSDNPYFESVEGVVFNEEITEVLFFPRGKSGTYDLPATVTKIANGVFRNVTLDTLNIPNTIEVIGDEAFRGSAIDNITFVGDTFAESLSIGAYAFYEATDFNVTLPQHTKSVGDHAFAFAADFGTLVLNEGIETLGDYAFYGAEAYSWSFKLAIPNTVKSIGAYCFAECDYEYVTVTLDSANSKLEYIGKHAFHGNDMDYFEMLPATVKVVDDYAFYDCYYLGYEGSAGFTIAENSQLEVIGAHAFYYCGYLRNITLPKSLHTIRAYAFDGCSNLETVTFEQGGTADLVLGSIYQNGTIVEVGHVFDGCSYLESVVLPERLVEIGAYSFYRAGYYSGNLSVTFGEGSRLATIGESAFYYSSLASITIPKTVKNLAPYVDSETGYTYDRMGIGAYAFYGLYDTLTEVIFELEGTEPLTIGEGAFEQCKLLTTLTLPARLAPYTDMNGNTVAPLANGAGVFAVNECKGLTSVFVEDGCEYYSSDANGVLYNADKTELIYYPVAREGSFTVPASVKKIGDKAFYYAEKLNAISFASGSVLEQIGDFAFERCKALEFIALPQGVKTLGESVFKNCTALGYLQLSKSVATFDGSMVEGCNSLSNIIVPVGNDNFYTDNGVLYNGDKTVLIIYPVNRDGESYTVLPGTVRIESNAFSNNKYLTEVILPEGLVEIGEYAFDNSVELASVEIPASVSIIDNWAFTGCQKLADLSFTEGGSTKLIIGKYAFQRIAATSVKLPARVGSLDHYVFYGANIENIEFAENSQLVELGDQVFQNTKLVNVELPDGIVTIGEGLFYGCTNLQSVVFGEGLVTLGDATFEGSSVVSVHFPASLKTLGIETFKEVSTLTSVTFAQGSQLEAIPAGTFYKSGIQSIIIPASVKEISDKDLSSGYSYGAFQEATALTSVVFEDGALCEKIGIRAFYGCEALEEITIPASVSTLGESAFEGCSALTEIVIPATVTQLGSSLFNGCSALETVVLETKASELPGFMFTGCSSLKELTIPSNIASFGSSCFSGSGVGAFTVVEDNAYFASFDGVIYSKDMTSIVLYPPQRTDTTLVIPKEVTEIGAGTFQSNTTLKKVIFEEGGEADLVIGSEAFYSCYLLNTVILPERLTVIGESAFMYCKGLTNITVPSTVTEIQDDAFYGCDKLVEIFNKSELEISLDDYYGNGYITYNAANVYTPDEGASCISVVDDFVIYTDEDGSYLLGYNGDLTDITLPEVDGIYKYAFYYRYDLNTILIPEGVGESYMGSSAFYYADNLTILCEAASKPSEWSSSWSSSCTVIWGYTGDEYTVTFDSNGAGSIDPITTTLLVTIPEVSLDGYYFMGWFDNAEFSGAPISGSYYSGTDVTLYARFLTEEQYLEEMLKGTSMEYAHNGVSGAYYKNEITEGGAKMYIKLTVEAGETWNITTTHIDGYSSDHKIWMYNEEGSSIDSKDTGYTENWDYTFDSAGTYYVVVGYYYTYSSYVGNIGVTLTKLS